MTPEYLATRLDDLTPDERAGVLALEARMAAPPDPAPADDTRYDEDGIAYPRGCGLGRTRDEIERDS